MICRWCGEEIVRGSPLGDQLICIFSSKQLSEAWDDGEHTVCGESNMDVPRRWHEPLLLTSEEMLNDLRFIEADLRS